MNLPKNFRKLSIFERRETLLKLLPELTSYFNHLDASEKVLDMADAMIESAVGIYPEPVGLATGFVIDGKNYMIPMATEEPSVIAAAGHAALIIKRGGGFITKPARSIVTTQVFIEGARNDFEATFSNYHEEIKKHVDELMTQMVERGGGFVDCDLEAKNHPHIMAVNIHLDVVDAMGANVANTVAENLKEYIASISEGKAIMCILTNDAKRRMVQSSFSLPIDMMGEANYSGSYIAESIVKAYEIACHFPSRAVTHNKGVMNGITALALATGNDTRAVEASAHYFASKENGYKPLTHYSIEGGSLTGRIDIPLSLGTVGGATKSSKASQWAMKILNTPDAKILSSIAASLGLAQNFAALRALVTTGIQKGHMRLHAERIAYEAGARGKDIKALAEIISREKVTNIEKAKIILSKMKI